MQKIKALNPKSADTKYTGMEPEWTSQPAQEQRRAAVLHALNWYNYHYDKKTAKQCILDWLIQHQHSDLAKAFSRVPDGTVSQQAGWLSRMSLRGLDLQDDEQDFVVNTVKDLVAANQSVREVVQESQPVVDKINIQDRLRNKAMEVAGELECMYDDFIASGDKMNANIKPMAVLRGMNYPAQMISLVRDPWQARLDELHLALGGDDPDVSYAYGHWNRNQLKNLIKLVEQVLADCASYVQIKKVERKPRKTKAVSPEHRARKFKHLLEFGELQLTGLPAAKLVDCSEAWLYDTKKRKLIHLVADSHIGSITVKNNMLLGLSEAQSLQKTLRKPADTLKQLAVASKPNARKVFKEVKTTETAFNGRGSDNIMVLKVY